MASVSTGLTSSSTSLGSTSAGLASSSTSLASSSTGLAFSSTSLASFSSGLAFSLTSLASTSTGLASSSTSLASSSTGLASSSTKLASSSKGLAPSSTSVASSSTGLASSSTALGSSSTGFASSSTSWISPSTSLASPSTGVDSSSMDLASSFPSSTSTETLSIIVTISSELCSCVIASSHTREASLLSPSQPTTGSSLGIGSWTLAVSCSSFGETNSDSKVGSTATEGTFCTLALRALSSHFTSSVEWIFSKEFVTSPSATSGNCALGIACSSAIAYEDSNELSSVRVSVNSLDSLSGIKSSSISGGEDSTVISSVFVSADSESASKSPRSIRGVDATSVSSGSDEICSNPSVVFGCSSTFSGGVLVSIEISSSWSGAAAKGSNDEISIRFSP